MLLLAAAAVMTIGYTATVLRWGPGIGGASIPVNAHHELEARTRKSHGALLVLHTW